MLDLGSLELPVQASARAMQKKKDLITNATGYVQVSRFQRGQALCHPCSVRLKVGSIRKERGAFPVLWKLWSRGNQTILEYSKKNERVCQDVAGKHGHEGSNNDRRRGGKGNQLSSSGTKGFHRLLLLFSWPFRWQEIANSELRIGRSATSKRFQGTVCKFHQEHGQSLC